ncbi:TerC family protein [Listeria booriae]|uniref:TerC family protein n=1 Tax=Listeria booriae TaxID=1552123 RepID=UPI001624F758|nr:TerC family protein [Listeria booriae]MBC1917661.1 TerC family protein [Listeria booriae]
MDTAMILEYGWVLLVLIGLEGILAADNAVVMAVMVKHLPDEQQKKALFYGLIGAFVFRFAALFLISFLAEVWQVQALGAAYLLYICISHMWKHAKGKDDDHKVKEGKVSSFWMTVLKVEIADIAFAIDSMLAAVALAITLPATGWGTIGGLDTGQFAVMFIGGLIGLICIRFAATQFVKLLKKYPSLETAAFLIVGWVGVKLVVYTLAHPELGIIPEHFPHSTVWKLTFWAVMIGIIIWGWLVSVRAAKKNPESKA